MTELELVRSEVIPEQLENGKLYFSEKYRCAIHLCACGCGEKTVTPINAEHGWSLTIADEKPTLAPSIGNFAMPCRSHYFVRGGVIVWC